MSLVTPAELGTYLNDDSLNVERAQMMLDDAETLCETVLSPLPDAASVIVKRVAARGYITVTAARQVQLDMADAEYGASPGPIGGVYLMNADRLDLQALADDDAGVGSRGGAFSVDLLPTGYQPPVGPFVDPLGDWDTVS